MNQTTNFGLNQWSSTDRIQMEDFNADNAKIDAALSLGLLIQKLLSVTTTSPVAQLDVDVSSIDFTQYAEIKLYCHVPLTGGSVYLRLNGLTGYSYCRTYCDTMQSDPVSSVRTDSLAAWYSASDRTPSVNLDFHTPLPGASVTCDYTYIKVNAERYEYATFAAGAQTVTWDALESLNFSCQDYSSRAADVPAGTEIILYGTRK